jgi:hypothetical protein
MRFGLVPRKNARSATIDLTGTLEPSRVETLEANNDN